jgi:hypothetical protein
MAQVVHFSAELATKMLDQIDQQLDTGTGAIIRLYDGTMPTHPEDGIGAAVLLGECPCTVVASGGVGTVSGRTLTFNPITTDAVSPHSGSKTAAWARFLESDGTAHIDGNVGVVGSGAFVEMVSTTIVGGAPVAFTSGTISFP